VDRPKYYVGRSFQIYFLTILTGTLIDSAILSIQQSAPSFWMGVLNFFFIGGIVTAIACIPIFFILIFGFYYIYKNSKDEKHQWKNIQLLCFICSVLPMLLLLAGELLSSYRISYETFTWCLLTIPYALSATFYILYISRRDDLRNPPHFFESVAELDGVLDSGFEDDF